MSQEKWDQRYINLAKYISNWSKDDRKVGAVITRQNNTVSSIGVNGLPCNFPNEYEILNDKNLKNQMILHAEDNALDLSTENVNGYNIYIYPFPPCTHCSSRIIQNGIKRVIVPINTLWPDKWKRNFYFSIDNLIKMSVEVHWVKVMHNEISMEQRSEEYYQYIRENFDKLRLSIQEIQSGTDNKKFIKYFLEACELGRMKNNTIDENIQIISTDLITHMNELIENKY